MDGSNIATEGRTAPSLAQLNEAVTEFVKAHAYDNVVVIVDATFPNRIDESERAEYEEALLAGELLTPPAGAVGRGDAFVLQIADRTGATILSNDSFQEFHATYSWLFDDDRLWGGKPVPGVGWVFVPRVPVKGAVSRRSFREAKKKTDGSTARQPAKQAAASTRRGKKAEQPEVASKGGRRGRRSGSERAEKEPKPVRAAGGRADQHAAGVPRLRHGPPDRLHRRRHDRRVLVPRRVRRGRRSSLLHPSEVDG